MVFIEPKPLINKEKQGLESVPASHNLVVNALR